MPRSNRRRAAHPTRPNYEAPTCPGIGRLNSDRHLVRVDHYTSEPEERGTNDFDKTDFRQHRVAGGWSTRLRKWK